VPGRRKPEASFTLIELLVVVVVLAVLAAVVLPKLYHQRIRAQESALKNDLKIVRVAVCRFYSDTSLYPDKLGDLTASKAPTGGFDRLGLLQMLNKKEWQGPYLVTVPKDPVSGKELDYYTVLKNGHVVGEVRSSARGTSHDGTPYERW